MIMVKNVAHLLDRAAQECPDKPEGREALNFAERNRKLAEAREARALRRQ